MGEWQEDAQTERGICDPGIQVIRSVECRCCHSRRARARPGIQGKALVLLYSVISCSLPLDPRLREDDSVAAARFVDAITRATVSFPASETRPGIQRLVPLPLDPSS